MAFCLYGLTGKCEMRWGASKRQTREFQAILPVWARLRLGDFAYAESPDSGIEAHFSVYDREVSFLIL
jgi:hypothetical protein